MASRLPILPVIETPVIEPPVPDGETKEPSVGQLQPMLAPFRRALRRASGSLARELPWIGVDDPWAVFVSEVMLQQTSTQRVLDPWRRFLDAYPTPSALGRAPLADVLRHWVGLGYPRRAKALHDAARQMVARHDGRVPRRVEELLALSGVGPYTAHAVASFAFSQRVAVLDTNVGRVLARALANRPLGPREAQRLATMLLPSRDVAAFNQAMLDLGAQFCTASPRCETCPVRAECRWRREGGVDPAPSSAAVSRRQGKYPGSDREVRGRILRRLLDGAVSARHLERDLADVDTARLGALVDTLVLEGLISRQGGRLCLGEDAGEGH